MTETLDLQKIYSELNETIKKSDYNQCLNIANKILNSFPNEKEAIQCKLVSLINLGKSDELITFIEKNSLEKEYYLEYSYCLYDSKEYKKSLEILNNLSEKSNEIEILKAQSPIPNPQSPIPNPQSPIINYFSKLNNLFILL